MKKFLLLLLSLTIIVSLFAGCGKKEAGSGAYGLVDDSNSVDLSGAPDEIVLTGKSAEYDGQGVAINGNVITISQEGEYYFTGILEDGQIVVDTGDTAGSVYVYLDNADITCLTAPAIYVLQAKKVHIVLLKGTSNRIVSGTAADLESYNENANGGAIFAEDDLDIEGEGALSVFGYINNGITGKDDVSLEGGTVSILAANNGIKASESFIATGGVLDITCSNDGIKTTSADKEGKGFITIDGGIFSLDVGGDGISAETELSVNGGIFDIVSSGDRMTGSCKGMKAGSLLTINGGTFAVSCDDHSISSKGGMLISGGALELSSTSGKGLSAESNVELTGGTVKISAFTDGIETKGDVLLSGASVSVIAGEDGIKSGVKGDGFTQDTGVISISAGTVNICAGLDPIDAKLSADISGGSLFAAGSPEKFKVFDSASVPYIACSISGTAGEMLKVNGSGEELCSCTFDTGYTAVIISVPELTSGAEYTLSTSDISVTAAAN